MILRLIDSLLRAHSLQEILSRCLRRLISHFLLRLNACYFHRMQYIQCVPKNYQPVRVLLKIKYFIRDILTQILSHKTITIFLLYFNFCKE